MDKVQESMSKMKDIFQRVGSDYVTWIVKNPSRASDMESSVKLISYLLHGRLKSKSTILPELIYCSANVLAFWHDHLIRKSSEQAKREAEVQEGGGNIRIDGPSLSADYLTNQRDARNAQISKIKSTLTIIDYLEVFVEVSARHLWGEFGRWIVIIIVQAMIQVVKTITYFCARTGLRAALLFHYKVGMVGTNAVQQRQRVRVDPPRQANGTVSPNVVFVLKHSGRAVRKLHAAPPVAARDWTVPTCPDLPTVPQELPQIRMIAEVIHLLRPLTHLVSMGFWGNYSWKSWLLSFAMDVTSLQLHEQHGRLCKDDKIELTRRTYSLCYYLLRSPFYDKYTKRRLLGTLNCLADRIPIVGSICGALAHSIPEWQDTYSYMWTDF